MVNAVLRSTRSNCGPSSSNSCCWPSVIFRVTTCAKASCQWFAVNPFSSGLPLGASGNRSATSITRPGAITVRRWHRFSSSRTFPRHCLCIKLSSAALDNALDSTSSWWAATSRNCRASAGTSSGRSRSGGNAIAITLSRWYRSSRNEPSATRASRS